MIVEELTDSPVDPLTPLVEEDTMSRKIKESVLFLRGGNPFKNLTAPRGTHHGITGMRVFQVSMAGIKRLE